MTGRRQRPSMRKRGVYRKKGSEEREIVRPGNRGEFQHFNENKYQLSRSNPHFREVDVGQELRASKVKTGRVGGKL